MIRDSQSLCRTSMPGGEMPASLRRWLVFNAVGALGFLVQLATLALLMGRLGWGYVTGTALAVEVAVIHNFFWHQRWTWADRADHGWTAGCLRFLRFNLTNGALSIAGNLIFMRLFLDTLPVNYAAANSLAIAACSILNFVISDRLVFKGASTRSSALARQTQPSPNRQISEEEL